MKKLICLLFATLLSSTVYATNFVEGEHYKVINSTSSATPQVMEFFSYFCPHCYNFEPIAAKLKQVLPADVAFKRAPVAFMGRHMGPELQKALAVAEILAVDDKLTTALFSLIHEKRTPPRSREEVKQLFEQLGVSADVFNSHIDSMPVLSAVADYDHHMEKLNIRSVPSFVVNDKYLIIVSALESKEQFNDLVAYLLSLPKTSASN